MTAASNSRRMSALALVAAAAVALSGCGIVDRVTTHIADAVGPGPGTTQNIFNLDVGDCQVGTFDGARDLSTITTIDCTEAHDTEIYAASTLPNGEFPGNAAIDAQADADCFAAFRNFIGEEYDDSIYDFSWYFPTAGSWAEGDREILCLVYDGQLGQISGSLAGIAE
jgi:hypothetical protein